MSKNKKDNAPVLVIEVEKLARAKGIENGNQLRQALQTWSGKDCPPIKASRLFSQRFRLLDLETLTELYGFFGIKLNLGGILKWSDPTKTIIVSDIGRLAKKIQRSPGESGEDRGLIRNGGQLAEELKKINPAIGFQAPLGRRLFRNQFSRISLDVLDALMLLLKVEPVAPFARLTGEEAVAYRQALTGEVTEEDLKTVRAGRPSNAFVKLKAEVEARNAGRNEAKRIKRAAAAKVRAEKPKRARKAQSVAEVA